MKNGSSKLAFDFAFVLAGAAFICGAALAQSKPQFGLPAPAAKPQAGPRPTAKPPPRRLVTGSVLHFAGSGIYIAGDGFSLEQAIDDGLRESGGRSLFALLVLGAEISKLGIHGATGETSAVILKANQGGGTLYVCERDVKRQGFAAHEFLPGVQIVRGSGKFEAETGAIQSSQPGAAPLAPLLRMRALCAD